MSQPQQQEVLTVSAFLQSAQEARANHPPGTVFGYEKLRIMADNDSASNNPLDLRYLHFRNVDFRDLDASGALCEGANAYRCNFRGSDWSKAQGRLFIYGSDVSDANFANASGFSFCDAYNLHFLPAKGLTAEQAKSIIPVSNETRWLLGTCNTEHFEYIIDQQKRILRLEATVAALAAQVAQLARQRQ